MSTAIVSGSMGMDGSASESDSSGGAGLSSRTYLHAEQQNIVVAPDAASVSVWSGGSLLKVRLPGLRGERRGGGQRGKVKAFTRQSRMRLLERVHMVEQEGSALFLTLTLPDGLDDYSGKALKGWLRAFWARVRRRFPRAAALWRLESVKRKSGQQIGMPVGHLHLLVWNVVAAPGLREWVSAAWFEVVGSGDVKHLRAGTRLELPRSWADVRRYASKRLYVAKDGDDGSGSVEAPGRWWGFLSRVDVPWADELVRALSPREAFRLLRVLRNYVKADRRARGLSPPPGRALMRWRSFFVGDGTFWADRLAVVGWLV